MAMTILNISLKRVQTFIFDVPRLRAMLGANALIGQALRYELPGLMGDRGLPLEWPAGIGYQGPPDPLDAAADPADRDDPAALYRRGILARDGGHFIAAFADRESAEDFLPLAEEKLAALLPGVLFDAELTDVTSGALDATRPDRDERPVDKPREIQLFDLPVLQVCTETGQEPASEGVDDIDGDKRYRARSVTHRLEWGRKFYLGRETRDIISLMRDALYPPDKGKRAEDLAKLAAGGYLALIHADGNGIGQRYKDFQTDRSQGDKTPVTEVIDVLKEAHGEAFFHSMRVVVRRAIVDALDKTFTESYDVRPYEVLMLGGDDLLLVCRAERALDLACNYAAELEKYLLADGKPLHVAIGVAIAQDAYPLHRLHELAEALAGSAKRLYRSLRDDSAKHGLAPESATDDQGGHLQVLGSVIDWQVVTQSWFAGVANARRQSERVTYGVETGTETLLLTGRPYLTSGNEGLTALLAAARHLDGGDKAARSPLRALRGACEQGRLAGEMAFARLPENVKQHLGWRLGSKPTLWDAREVGGQVFHLTRAMDIVGIRDIARLGSNRHD